ncbi:MAG: DUF1385 domain-containing protein [Miltoncostaeaceae bacterium]
MRPPPQDPREGSEITSPSAGATGTEAVPTVGGSALPGGVMMRTADRVGVAVRREDDGEIVTESFTVDPPRGAWAKWPLMRGVIAIRAAVVTGQRAMTIGERLRWEEVRPAAEPGGAAQDAAAGPSRGGAEDDAPGRREPARDDHDTPVVAEPELAADTPLLGIWGKLGVGLGALLGFGLQILLFRVGPVVIAKEAGLTGAWFIVADAALRLVLLLSTLLLLSLLPPFRKILKYHGAEHQAIAAHEARAPLTAAAAAGFSRFHPRCGTSFPGVSAVVSIAVYGAVLAITGIFTYLALIATRIIGAPIVTAISFELQRQASKHADGRLRFLSWPGMAAQHLTTQKPAESELQVAVAALGVALEPAQDPEGADGREASSAGDGPAAGVAPAPAPSL